MCRHVDSVLQVPSAIYTSNNRLKDEAICLFVMIEVLIENINRKLREANEI